MEIETPEHAVDRLREQEPHAMRRLRWLLAMAYTGGPPRLYTDDGEYSDCESGIDFRRDPVPLIEAKMHAHAKRKMHNAVFSRVFARSANTGCCPDLVDTLDAPYTDAQAASRS